MSKLLLHLLVFTNAIVLAFPPSWCCMVRLTSKRAEDKHQCCCQKESTPSDSDSEENPSQSLDCYCHVDSTLPPHPEVIAKDLAHGPVMTLTESTLVGAGVCQDVPVDTAAPPPLQILHCIWLC